MWSFFGRDNSSHFPYELQEKYGDSYNQDSCFSLYKGVSKTTKENVTIFVYDKKLGSNEQYEHAKACIKRLKTLRHPSILTFLDSQENDSNICIATEFVEPLSDFITKINDLPKKHLYLSWGILNIVKGVAFLHNDARLKHNNIFSGSVFVNSAGEWKLGEVGYVSASNSSYPLKIHQGLQKYNPPEIKSGSCPDDSLYWSIDSWGLGIFMWEVFNGKMTHNNALKNITKIPEQLQPIYCELVAASPQKRLSTVKVLERPTKFFKNDVVDAMLFLDEIHIKSKEESKTFFSNIMPLLEIIPTCTATDKVLPQMIRAFEYGCDGACLIQPMMEISKSLQKPKYQQIILPFLLNLFASTDRATRSLLLQNIEHIIDSIPESIINENLFPLLTNGFVDANPRIREETIKAVVHLAPKLNNKNLNEEVLRYFARLQAKDEQGGIRTNTTVCLGKIAYCLCPQNRKAILLSAFIRALNDPFPPVRNAGVLAFAVSQQYFTLDDVGKKILPSLCHLTLDVDKSVRDSAFKTIKGFIGKLEKVSENPSLQQEIETEVMSTLKPVPSWAEWAVTAVASKFSSRTTDSKFESEGKQKMPSIDNKKKEVDNTKNNQETSEMERPSRKNSGPLNLFNSDTGKLLSASSDDKWLDQTQKTFWDISDDNITIDDNCDWDGESWVALEDPICEEKPEPKPIKKSRPVRQKENKKHQLGAVKLGTNTNSIKFD